MASIIALALALQDADRLLEQADALMGQKKHAEALAKYEQCLKVMAFEHFELKGERALRYGFSIVEDGEEKFYVSLGSYDRTTAFMRETGQIGKDERAFHLDGYFDGGRRHSTYGIYKKEPTWDECRAMVAEILEGKRKASSSSGPGDKR